MERSLMVAESSWLKKAVDDHVLEAAANPDHEAEIVQDPNPGQDHDLLDAPDPQLPGDHAPDPNLVIAEEQDPDLATEDRGPWKGKTVQAKDRLPEVEVVLQKEAGPDLNPKTERIEMETNPITKI